MHGVPPCSAVLVLRFSELDIPLAELQQLMVVIE